MKRLGSTVFYFFAFLLFASSPIDTKLVLVGGGSTPEAAIEYMVKAGGGKEASALVITWAANPLLKEDEPKSLAEPTTFQKIESRFKKYSIGSIEEAPKRADLLAGNFLQETKKKIEQASIIFFSGGDQDFIMGVLKKYPELKALLKKKFAEGTVFGGTSAGTAIMSDLMITSEEEKGKPEKFKVEEGLGLLPENWVADQHFNKRAGRTERMTAVLSQDPKYFDRWNKDVLKKYKNKKYFGLGVYEDCAFLVLSGSRARVLKDEKIPPPKTEEIFGEVFRQDSLSRPLKINASKQIDLLTAEELNLLKHSESATHK